MVNVPHRERRIGLLIVDNEAGIVNLLKTVLADGGFVIWSATNSQEAIRLFQQHAADIDLVLSDVSMPGLDGPHLMGVLRQISSALRFCFMTGESADYSEGDLYAAGALHVFPKPFPSIAMLKTRLRELAAKQGEAPGYLSGPISS